MRKGRKNRLKLRRAPGQTWIIIYPCLLLIAIGASLAGCGEAAAATLIEDSSSQAGAFNGALTATRTPFQAVKPTHTPTLTPTPMPTSTPTLTATPTDLPCITNAGSIEQFEIAFSDGAHPLHFRVYTPPCFGHDQQRHYPVLYMIHGQTYSDDQWPRLGIDRAADELIQSEKSPPFLIVMPREDNTFADIYLSSFSRDVLDGLVPWVDAHYPTCAERACRAVGGLSRGGAWALHLGFTRWDLFGAIGLHSTPPFNTDPGRFPAWVQAIPADQLPRVYMDAGRQDPFLSMASAFEDQLVRFGVPHEWYIFNGAHNEEYWSTHAVDYLEWYAQGWGK